MATSKTLYVILSLPGQNVDQQLAEHYLSNYCLDANVMKIATGNQQVALDESGRPILIDSPSGAKRARELFETALMSRVIAGDPTIILNATGKHGLKFLKHIDPSYGFVIRFVDFVAPILNDAVQKLEWAALKKDLDEGNTAGLSPHDWLDDQADESWQGPTKETIDQASELLCHELSRKPAIYNDEKLIRVALTRYQSIIEQDLGWDVDTPDEFFDEIQAPLKFPSPWIQSKYSATDRPLLIVGDIHGDADDLAQILTAHPYSDITLLGDYFDRTDHAGGNIAVFKLLMSQINRLHLLTGNHELALRKALIEGRGVSGGLQQATVDEFNNSDITQDMLRLFFTKLETYRAFSYHHQDFFLSHAGVEPEIVGQWRSRRLDQLRIAFASTEALVYGIKPVGGSAYDRDIDEAWVKSVYQGYTVQVHGHRNRFDRDVMPAEDSFAYSVNLADADTTTIRYLEVEGKRYAMHIRQRFTEDEKVIKGRF